MLDRGGHNDQDILAYFTRPTRSVNHRVIAEIRTGAKHRTVKAATEEELNAFLTTWPEIDPQTGLSLHGDELLIKAREAMIAAVHIFNSAGLTFRAELFIVTAVIAWTYLLHAFFRREAIDYRYYVTVHGRREVEKTENGAEKYWELGKCLRQNECPLDKGAKQNLEFLLEFRHEIEHRSTTRLDDAISAALQACCINFNDTIKMLFGRQYGLERRLPIALQFVSFDADQRAALKKAANLPPHVATMMIAFLDRLSDEELADPRFSYRVAFVPKVANRASAADMAVEFVRAGTEQAAEINRVLLKEVEKPKYKPGQIRDAIRAEGFPNFNMSHHTELWKALDAQNPAKSFGVRMLDGQWYWYENWLARVRAHCEENEGATGKVCVRLRSGFAFEHSRLYPLGGGTAGWRRSRSTIHAFVPRRGEIAFLATVGALENAETRPANPRRTSPLTLTFGRRTFFNLQSSPLQASPGC